MSDTTRGMINTFLQYGTIGLIVLAIIGFFTPFFLSKWYTHDARSIGRLTLNLIKLGEIPMLILLLYVISYKRYSEKLTTTMWIQIIYLSALLFHIIVFTLASSAVIYHTYTLYLSGRVCGANNILMVVLIIITVLEYFLWHSGWLIWIPDTTLKKFLIWLYIIFILSYLGPVMAHSSSIANGTT
ncbi:MAG: hypothetical protein INQ03_14245 [Candidatus Heimdallarchaeota archaeon]|nr:hypothetical protein [Candidatus Heimdallarchaeota archaeon]